MDEYGGLAALDFAVIAVFLLAVTTIGYLAAKVASKNIDEYFLGGKKLPWWLLGVSSAAANIDMSGTMLIVGVVFGLGYKGLLVEIRGGAVMCAAVLMVTLGKWLRRSRVMTSAEWMKTRFGFDGQGRAAHALSALANITLSLGMITYFCKGSGKFLVHFLPLSEVAATSIMVAIGLYYTIMAGLRGVVFTDMVQMVLIVFTTVVATVQGFQLADQITFPAGFLDINLSIAEGLGASLLAKDPAAWEPVLGAFGMSVAMWSVRTFLEGTGGVGGYTDQRFFAAHSERDASLLTFQAVVVSVFRWTMVGGLAVMGYYVLSQGGATAEIIRKDAEQVLPVVLGQRLPMGVRGLVITGLIAAAVSTFASTLNAGASYLTKDLFQTYLNPTADSKTLVKVSRVSTALLCVAGILLATMIPNINAVWGLITMGICAGLYIPLFLRWYWPRFNGYGFAGGTAAGLIAGLLFKGWLNWPVYQSFPLIILSALVPAVLVSLRTRPISEDVLLGFWHQVNPWGLWGRYAKLALDRGLVDQQEITRRRSERRRDALAICFSVPGQLTLLMSALAFIFHDWSKLTSLLTVTGICWAGLYFVWYKNLKSPEQCEEEDQAAKSDAGSSPGGSMSAPPTDRLGQAPC